MWKCHTVVAGGGGERERERERERDDFSDIVPSEK